MNLDELERLKASAYRWQYTEKLLESADELIAMARQAQEYRAALAEIRIHLHAMGRRPETCYPMSVIDAAMQEQKP